LWNAALHVDQGQYLSPDALQIRQAGRPAPQIIRLQPAPHSKTKVLSHSLKVSPVQPFRQPAAGPLRQLPRRHVFPEPVTELKIEVDLVADMTVYNPFDFFVEERPRPGRSPIPETCATTCRST
jgi:transglutaminase-like putative cysteine protease